MTIRSDSYSSVDEVTAFVRHLLDGALAFSSATRPTLTEVEKFIDRASGVLNIALYAAGFAPSAIYANAVAKLACDDWVTQKAARFVELTQRGTGYNEDEGSRTAALNPKDATEFVEMFKLGFVNAGISQTTSLSEGLQYTALTAQADRTDPDDTSLEQPLFVRRSFDNS